jgi:hypothetical protein
MKRERGLEVMKRVYSVIGLIMILGFVAMSAASCKKAAGGGWTDVSLFWDGENWVSSDEPSGKATFGFIAKCEDVDGELLLKVQLQYHDHYNKIKFHGEGQIQGTLNGFYSCADLDTIGDNQFFGYGIYTPQPKRQFEETEVGTFLLHVVDGGEPGTSEGDRFEITLDGGPFAGYSNSGFLQGGNIQVFED